MLIIHDVTLTLVILSETSSFYELKLTRLYVLSCTKLYFERGLPLSHNSALHVRPRISTLRPPPVIVGLIWTCDLYKECRNINLH